MIVVFIAPAGTNACCSIMKGAAMSLKAILFGSVGTLVETSEIQREAFNKAFREAELDWDWDWDVALYQRLLNTPGGKNRIQAHAKKRGMTVNAAKLHAAKTENFENAVAKGDLKARPGVEQVVRYALENKLKIGFVTTTSQANIDTTFKALGDQITKDMFDFIGKADLVTANKPAPDIYLKALEELDVAAQDAIAVEDTTNSLTAATSAGLQTIAFPGANSMEQDFSGASLITEILHPDQFQTLAGKGRANISQDFSPSSKAVA